VLRLEGLGLQELIDIVSKMIKKNIASIIANIVRKTPPHRFRLLRHSARTRSGQFGFVTVLRLQGLGLQDLIAIQCSHDTKRSQFEVTKASDRGASQSAWPAQLWRRPKGSARTYRSPDPGRGGLSFRQHRQGGRKANTDPLFAEDPFIAPNRRVTITLIREAPPVPPNLQP
jgi:hypothetical protein